MGQVGAVIAIAGMGQRNQGIAHFSAGTGHFTDFIARSQTAASAAAAMHCSPR